jgi:putative radical SAM enzyme (TIGR03279 family)
VHATDLELRRHFLGRKDAPDVVEQLRRLAGLGIEVHTQVVLVPGLNDGEHLTTTINDLAALYGKPVASVGVVPIGLTRYHRGSCRTYTVGEARAVLEQLEEWRMKNRPQRGCGFVYPADEWYLVAGRNVPPASAYDGFPQLENGVGMVRQLLDDWEELKVGLPLAGLRSATVVCGMLIAPVLGRIVAELNHLLDGTGVSWQVVPVVNRLFGASTTVSGLLTGQDVVAALQDHRWGTAVLLPRAMFTGQHRAGSAPPGSTLDDMSLDDISARIGVPAITASTLTGAMGALTDPRQHK